MSFSFPSFAETEITIVGHNEVDKEGQVGGGYAADDCVDISSGKLPGFMIRWQDGPLDRNSNESKQMEHLSRIFSRYVGSVLKHVSE